HQQNTANAPVCHRISFRTSASAIPTYSSKSLREYSLRLRVRCLERHLAEIVGTALVVAAAACGGVLDILLGLGGLVLLRFQVGLYRQVRLRLTVGIGSGTSRRTGGNAVLTLVFADLGLEVVVHVLQILNGHGNL